MDDIDEDSEEYLDLDNESFSIEKFDVEKYIKDVSEDIRLLKTIQEKASKLVEIEDIKLAKLFSILEDNKDKKILIFSQYADTTNYIIEKLKNRI
jgi:ERCC4-related helicase